MNITTKKNDAYSITATIELAPDDLAPHIAAVKQAATQEIEVEGFRKGKAPQHLAEQKLNPDAVRAEAFERALESSFELAVAQEKWDVRVTSDLNVERNDTSGVRYSVRVHLWPLIELPDLAAVQEARKPIDVSDAEVNESLATIRNMRATFLDKTDAIADGDRVELDFDATQGGKPIEGGSSRNHPLIIGGKSFMPGFEEALVGLKTGEQKQFSLTAPKDYYEQKLAGTVIDFSVTVRRVQSVIQPPADDAFAASLGKFTTIDQLKKSIREGIEQEKRVKESQRVRLAILDAIIKKTDVPVPDDMVADELNEMIHRFGHDLQHRGLDLSMYLARMKKTEDQLRADWKPEAKRQVQIMLVLRAVSQQQNISVSSEELDRIVEDTMAELVRRGQQLDEHTNPQQLRSSLSDRIITDRTLEFLEKTCVVA